ncbi:hypothetical protein GJAV_G00254270 [Gymnothorax javanicus]|nr:hypothetical protein GJAV_G00254270 [Gymnothorax javanicus]
MLLSPGRGATVRSLPTHLYRACQVPTPRLRRTDLYNAARETGLQACPLHTSHPLPPPAELDMGHVLLSQQDRRSPGQVRVRES